MRVNPAINTQTKGADVKSTKQAERAGAVEGDKKKAGTGASTAADPGAANTTISSRAKDAARAKQAADAAPDVREEKIAELKRMVAAGKYKVDAEAVADRMVDEHLKTADIG